MLSADMGLAARAAELNKIISCCSITLRSNDVCGIEAGVSKFCDRLIRLRTAGRNLYIVGNGGSSSVAGHAAIDFFKVGRLKATTLHESAMVTCMANDYGYENAFSKMLSQLLQPDDVVILISSSGQSMNILNAAKMAEDSGGFIVTLSGFSSDNPLRSMGDINIWLDSNDYGFVEVGHQFILHNISDRLGILGG